MTEPTLPGPEDQVTDEQIMDILAGVQDEHSDTPPLPGLRAGAIVTWYDSPWTVASRHLVSPSTGEPYNVLRNGDGVEIGVPDAVLDDIARLTRGLDDLRRTFGQQSWRAAAGALGGLALRQHILDTGEDIRGTAPGWQYNIAGLVWDAAAPEGRAELTAMVNEILTEYVRAQESCRG